MRAKREFSHAIYAIGREEKAVFSTLQTAITEYMNNTQWGNAQFLVNEKIDCKLFFTIASVEGTKMTGDLQVQSSRPVYNAIINPLSSIELFSM